MFVTVAILPEEVFQRRGHSVTYFFPALESGSALGESGGKLEKLANSENCGPPLLGPYSRDAI